VFSVVQRIRQMNVSVLIVEQNAVHTLRLADRGYVLESGQMVLQGKASDLLANPGLRSAYLGL
jgi:branched-chain amino acid transport system ATP-binding protein